jgi:antitoxin FitA
MNGDSMTMVTIEFDDNLLQRLQVSAEKQGISLEDIVRLSIDEYLARRQDFERAAGYVIKKNSELYERLAK